MTTKLKDADIFKVDLVPAGAQQLSTISIMKSKEGNSVSKTQPTKQTKQTKPIKKTQPAKPINALANIKKGITEDKVKAFFAAIGELLEDIDDEGPDAEDQEKYGEEDEDDEVAETAEVDKEEDDCEKEDTEEEEEDPMKGTVAKSNNAIIQKMQKDQRDLIKKIAQMEEEKSTEVYLRKASSLTSVPGATTQELANIMKSVNVNCPAAIAAKLENIFKCSNAAISTGGIFQDFGSGMDSNVSTPDDAYAALEKMASERVTKGANENMGDAWSAVLKTKEGAQLYNVCNGRGKR